MSALNQKKKDGKHRKSKTYSVSAGEKVKYKISKPVSDPSNHTDNIKFEFCISKEETNKAKFERKVSEI